MVTALAMLILTSPPLATGAAAPLDMGTCTSLKNPGKIAALLITSSPPRMNTSLPSTTAPPVMLIRPSCGNESTLNPVPSKGASPAEATLTRFTRPPGARTKPAGGCPEGAPTFTGPPTNDSVPPKGTCSTLVWFGVGLNTPAWTSMDLGLAVRNPNEDDGATFSMVG